MKRPTLLTTRSVIAVLLFALLPSVAVGALTLAQTGLPYEPLVKSLAGADMSYWFLALAAIAIASWSFIAKWLLQQLESQRTANTELLNKLVNYMATDHAQTVVVMTSVADILGQVVDKLDLQPSNPQHPKKHP